MKRITVLTVICLFSLSVFAQLDFGVKAGLNLTNISADMVAGDYEIKSKPGSQVGYHFGGLMRASLFGLYVQPELYFSSLATEYAVTDQITSVEEIAKQRIGRIDVPVILGAKLGGLRIGLGPVASIIVADNNELFDKTGYETSLKSATIGYQVGGGLDVWKFGFDVRYEGNLSKLGDEIMVGAQPMKFDTRAKQILFSVSYRF